MGLERPLHFGGGHVHAHGLDHVLQSLREVQAAVGVEGAEVAGVEETALVEAVAWSNSVIMTHLRRRADDDLTLLAGRAARAALGIDDAQLHTRQRPAARAADRRGFVAGPGAEKHEG